MPEYNELALSTLRLIADSGQTYDMSRKKEQGFDDYDPVTGDGSQDLAANNLNWKCSAVVLPAKNRLVEDNKLVLQKARMVLVAARNEQGEIIPEIQAEDRIVIDGETWKVFESTPLKPADVAILYRVGATRIS